MIYKLSLPLIILQVMLSSIQADSQPVAKPFINSHFIMADSVLIHYRTWNDKMEHPRGKVLLIHGFAGSTFCFRNQYDTLEKSGYRVIAVDLPGVGYSDRSPHINQSNSNRAKIIWALLESIDQGDLTEWNIVGHSMGGGTAEAVACAQPKRIKTLIIIDGMLFNKTNDLMSTAYSMTNNKTVKRFMESYTKKKLTTYKKMSHLLKSAYGRKPDSTEVEGYLKPLSLPGTVDAVMNMFYNSKEIQHLHSDSLKNKPVLGIWGSGDKWIPTRMLALYKQYIPSMKIHTIKKARHMPMETHPVEFNRVFIGYLNEHNH
jgi:2-hydroxy-6-oxonona-2,4-dienedioate hydrolase